MNVNLCYNAHFPFLNRDMISSVRKNKLFALLCCIKYLSDRISPQSEFKKNLINLIEESGRLILIKDMGFPEHWKSFDIWKD